VTKGIYVTGTGDVFYICKLSDTNFGISLFSSRSIQKAKFVGKGIATILGVKFYSGRPSCLRSEIIDLGLDLEGLMENGSYVFVDRTLSNEFGVYIRSGSDDKKLLFVVPCKKAIDCSRKLGDLLKLKVVVGIKIGERRETMSSGDVCKDVVELSPSGRIKGAMSLACSMIKEGHSVDEIRKVLIDKYMRAGKDYTKARNSAYVAIYNAKKKLENNG